MGKALKRIQKFISIFYPKNIYRLLAYIYSKTSPPIDRTNELISVIKENKYINFIEVGVWEGQNIIAIAKEFPDTICYGVDPYDYMEYSNQLSLKDEKSHLLKSESENVYNKTLAYTKKYSNFHLIRKSSLDAAKEFEQESVDLVFIDANHSYESVKNDIDLWLQKVKPGGVLSGHDYSIDFFGVIQAVNEKLGTDNIVVKSDATWFYYEKSLKTRLNDRAPKGHQEVYR
jgi:SAM-dependent methyltransferase